MRIIGHGGGSKGGGAGGGLNEAPNTLKSVAYARVLDLIGEGEIEGLVNGLNSVYLDGVPVTNPDGSFNFQGFAGVIMPGTQGQSYIPSIPGVENETAVSSEVTNATPLVRTITDSTVDSVRVTLSVQGLSQTNSDGSIVGTSVEYAIDVQSNGGGYVTIVDSTIDGKTTSKYQRSHLIALTGSQPWDIRVRRITPDNGTAVLINKTFWDSYTQIVDAKLRYPNSAIVGISIDSSQFSHIPTRGYECKMLRIQIPANYDPLARTYTGAWDGTFQVAWSNNPAWCYYDLLTNERYGLGKYIDAAQIDKWTLYQIAQYCDELVPDGNGGTEPRFTCNVYLQTRQEAFSMLQQFASCFRAITYWSAGSLTAVQDAPSDPVAIYTQANVIDGRFTYQGSSARARHTVALVTWNDPTDLYRQKVEYVEDAAGIARYGINQTEIIAFGCTSQGQARRMGLWQLYSERLETETVSFRVGIDGIYARPGDVIQVADASRAGSRRGGRVLGVAGDTVTLDAPVALQAGVAYTLMGISAGALVTGSLTAVGAGTTTDVVTLTAPLALDVGTVWVLAGSDVEPQTFRVLSVTEPDPGVFEITALAHNPGKYADIDYGAPIDQPLVSTLTTALPAPTGLAAAEYLDSSNAGVLRSFLQISWDSVPGAKQYKLIFQINNDEPQVRYLTQPTFGEVQNDAGPVSISVQAIGVSGVPGLVSTTTVTTTKPAPVPPQPYQVSVIALDGAQGVSSPTLGSLFSVEVDMPNGYFDVPEPANLTKTDIIEVTNGISTSASAAKIAGLHLSPTYEFFFQYFTLAGYGSPVQAKIVNQYGNICSNLASLPLPDNAALLYQVSPSNAKAVKPVRNAVYVATNTSSGSVSCTLDSIDPAGDLSSISWSLVSGDTFAVGTPSVIYGSSYIAGYRTDFTVSSLVPGSRKAAIYRATVTFSDSSTVDVDFSIVVECTDNYFGYALS